MIKAAYLGKEILIKVVNKIGVLYDISKIAADHGINIEGVAGYAGDNQANIMLVTGDNLRAKDALIKAGYKDTTENPVVIVELENKPGVLKNITSKLAAKNVNIRYIYGTTCCEGCPSRMVLSTSNDEEALLAFKK